MRRTVSIVLLSGVLSFGMVFSLSLANPAQAADGKGEVCCPFNGQDLTSWKLKGDVKRSKWVVGRAVMDAKNPRQLRVTPLEAKAGAAPGQLVNAQGAGIDIYTEAKFGDCLIDLELMIPQGSNSGVYVMGEYEVQIYDSYGKTKLGFIDIGSIYSVSPPRVNAAKKPGEWQRFVIEFQAPRFENGKKVKNARFLKVTLNGQVIQENAEMKGPTPACLTGKEAPTGPLMFQGDHGPVAYRNIKIAPLKKE